jgi:hypothetical protein
MFDEPHWLAARLLIAAAAMLALTCIVAGIGEAKTIRLVHASKSDYSIVVSKDGSPSEKHAAAELQKFLSEISGATIPIVEEVHANSRHLIFLGDSAALRSEVPHLDLKSLGDEGFTIRTVGSNLVIAGGRRRGTLYGVYTFLEDVLGCRWYAASVSRIPHQSNVTIKSLNIVQKPDFEYREPYYTAAFDGDWAVRNKVNSHAAALDEDRGGKVIYGAFCHTMDSLVPAAKYFTEHPEYYALVNGKRLGGPSGQLCLTNPDVLRVATDTLMSWIAKNPQADIWSVTQNDNNNYCQCDRCKAAMAEEGSPSGLMLRFVNSVAGEVAKRYPSVLIDTFAYQYTEKPPKLTRPAPNVCVRLCPIRNCQFHPFEKCEKDAEFMDNLRGWHKLTDDLYIWHYNTDFANYMLPFPDLDELSADIPLYKRSGVRGVFLEGTYAAGGGAAGGAGFMDDLKAYLMAKMLWDSRTDAKAAIADFLDGYFGKAGRPIGEFLDILHQKVRADNIHGYIWEGPDAAYLSPDVMAKGDALFAEAERVADNPEVLHRVRHARLSLDFVKVMRKTKLAAASGDAQRKSKALRDLDEFRAACEADGITSWNEAQPISERYQQLAASLK